MKYIGQTKQYLSKRITAHKSECGERYRNKPSCEKTALATHHFELDHVFDFNNVVVLDKERNQYKRNISEMIDIQSQLDSINYRKDVEGLSLVYKGWLQRFG